jgi:hypothetical protein
MKATLVRSGRRLACRRTGHLARWLDLRSSTPPASGQPGAGTPYVRRNA